MPLVGGPPPPPSTAPARKPRTTTPKLADQTPPEPSRKEARSKILGGYSQIFEAGFLMFGQYADAETIHVHSPLLISPIADIADANESFGKTLDTAESVGPYMALALAALPMALQFMANHGRIDPARMSFGGIVSPDVMAANSQTRLMKAQALAIREQQQAREAALSAQQDLQQAYAEANGRIPTEEPISV
jgi:hypothetical protein